jgi:hypothetical protein
VIRSPLTIAAALTAVAIVGTVSTSADPGSLEEWLTRLDETAQLYATQARSFTCDETIQWDRKGETGRRKFGYVVVLDENGNFDDYRTRLKNRKALASLKRVKPEDYQVPSYLRSAYLWSFIFRRDRWPYHRYEIVGQESLKDRPAVILRFEPIPPYSPSVNNWFGSSGCSNSSFLLLRNVPLSESRSRTNNFPSLSNISVC